MVLLEELQTLDNFSTFMTHDFIRLDTSMYMHIRHAARSQFSSQVSQVRLQFQVSRGKCLGPLTNHDCTITELPTLTDLLGRTASLYRHCALIKKNAWSARHACTFTMTTNPQTTGIIVADITRLALKHWTANQIKSNQL